MDEVETLFWVRGVLWVWEVRSVVELIGIGSGSHVGKGISHAFDNDKSCVYGKACEWDIMWAWVTIMSMAIQVVLQLV